MVAALKPAADALELNYGAFELLARRVVEMGVPVGSLTLDQFGTLVESARKEYNALYGGPT